MKACHRGACPDPVVPHRGETIFGRQPVSTAGARLLDRGLRFVLPCLWPMYRGGCRVDDHRTLDGRRPTPLRRWALGGLRLAGSAREQSAGLGVENGRGGPPAIPESPDRILEDGLDCLQGMTVKRAVQDIKVVLVIFKGSSLRPEPSRKILEARYNCFEIASSAFSRQLNPFDKLP